MIRSYRLFEFAGLQLLLTLLLGCGGNADKESTPTAVSKESPSTQNQPLRSQAAENASVFFKAPTDGDVVSSPVNIEFGVTGMSIVPAGTDAEHSGHHHLLVDAGVPNTSLPIPKDANHVHFGDGSTATTIDLAPGEHTLTLLLGDYLHVPHEPPVLSKTITITVE